ncbi:hypothetical protein [Pseudophaeobacter profundi]|jgi:hypothetical protein|uniref:hypothetical protein n=1 Tax=Pseudophaeobacter profundi TaxID=3034152 RepID=UPI0024302DB1|nr:hypothetical protein [Pseudophaeobacter profundi]
MPHSKFKRPAGFEGIQSDPEESYRAGYQHGVRVMLRHLEAKPTPDMERLTEWVNSELTAWRHDTQAEPTPPAP